MDFCLTGGRGVTSGGDDGDLFSSCNKMDIPIDMMDFPLNFIPVKNKLV